MGITLEIVAKRYGVSRKQQDAAAVCYYASWSYWISVFKCLCCRTNPSVFNAGARVDVVKSFIRQVKSHQKAAAARASGRFKDEIISVHTKVLCGI